MQLPEPQEIDELEQFLKEYLNIIERKKNLNKALSNFVGKGKGIWNTNAQKYIDDLRSSERTIN
jgi:GTP1/Obg family GTP-binding protein